MQFQPLKIQSLNADGTSVITANPLTRQARDISEHVRALLSIMLEKESSPESNKLRMAFQLKVRIGGATTKFSSYEGISNLVDPILNDLERFLYGDSFRRGLANPLYPKSVFEDVKLLVARTLEELRLEEIKVPPHAYQAQELFLRFLQLYLGNAAGPYGVDRALKSDPNRRHILFMAELRDLAFFEGYHHAMDTLLKLIVESYVLDGKREGAELQREAQTLREEIEVEELWDRLARGI